MRIMRPDDRLGTNTAMSDDRLQGAEHMTVAQVPRCRTALIDGAVIALRLTHDPGVLCSIEPRFTIAR